MISSAKAVLKDTAGEVELANIETWDYPMVLLTFVG